MRSLNSVIASFPIKSVAKIFPIFFNTFCPKYFPSFYRTTLIFLKVFYIVLFSSTIGSAQSGWNMSEPIKEAYQLATSLRIEQSQQKIRAIKLQDPNNVLVYYIENYIDFFTVFIKEEKSAYLKFLKAKDQRLELLAQADPASPYYLFCQAEIILQAATVKLKFDDNVSAAHDVFKAYKMLEENKKLFPDFLENKKSLCIIYALADSLPSWIRKLLGIKGSIGQATTDIKSLADKALLENNMYKDEIVAIYSYILFYVNQQKAESFKLFDAYHCDHKTNPLIAFLKATFAQKSGNTPLAVRILEERPKGSTYMDFYYLDYLYGKYKLYNLEKDAHIPILKFLNNFKGRHYIKEAFQKLAWYHLVVKSDKVAYNKYIQMASLSGVALIDEDIQAMKEAEYTQPPDPILLKSRLLYDGGYLSKAKNILTINAQKYDHGHDGEFYYRLGRILDGLKNYTEALYYYDKTISKSDPKKYYSCSAALHAGIIHENNNKLQKAENYFIKCLSLNPDEYATSLHQKAETALQRVR